MRIRIGMGGEKGTYGAEGEDEGVLGHCEVDSVEVGHGEVYHPTLHPPSRWVERKGLRKDPVMNLSSGSRRNKESDEPEFGRDGIET